MDSATSTLWTGPFPVKGVACYFLLLPCFIETSVFNSNSEDPDQTLHSLASDLGVHCLPMSLLRGARHKGVRLNMHLDLLLFCLYMQQEINQPI